MDPTIGSDVYPAWHRYLSRWGKVFTVAESLEEPDENTTTDSERETSTWRLWGSPSAEAAKCSCTYTIGNGRHAEKQRIL